MQTYTHLTRAFFSSLAVASLCTVTAFASGGSLDYVDANCVSPTGKSPLIVLHLKSEVSSERVGESLVYGDKAKLADMLTSQASCYEYRTIVADPTLEKFEFRRTLMVCGNLQWGSTKSGHGGKVASIVPNKKGYRTLYWKTTDNMWHARLERKDAAGAYQNVFNEDLKCTETSNQ